MKTAELTDHLITEPVYTIGHAAKKLGVSVSLIRLYEKMGLIIPYRTETGRRLYSRNDISHIEMILKSVRENGLNLESLKVINSFTPCWIMSDCPPEHYQNCKAYTDCHLPCWTIKNKPCGVNENDCRECIVYTSSFERLDNPKAFFFKFLKA